MTHSGYTGCFQYVCHLTYIFCSIGVLQLVAVTMCVLSAMLTPVRSCFSVLCWYLPVWSCVYSIVYVTLFGKTGLNENCVEPFFSATHLETLKCIQKHSQCILKRLECSPTEIENVPYH